MFRFPREWPSAAVKSPPEGGGFAGTTFPDTYSAPTLSQPRPRPQKRETVKDPTAPTAPPCLTGTIVGKLNTAFRLTTLTAYDVEEGRIYHMQTSTVDGAPVDSGCALFVPKRPDVASEFKKYLELVEAELPRVVEVARQEAIKAAKAFEDEMAAAMASKIAEFDATYHPEVEAVAPVEAAPVEGGRPILRHPIEAPTVELSPSMAEEVAALEAKPKKTRKSAAAA